MKASSLSFLTAVVVALVGMAWGLHMAISQDHSTLTAHAHLNLLGWVSLFLFGVFYRLHPVLDGARIARLQVLIWLIGFGPFVLVQGPIMLLAAAMGVWLFYVQHQFESTTWADDAQWNHHDAALHGASYYVLPGILRWFTANIGVHHVHHLYCRIPSYRLRRVLRDYPELNNVGRLTLRESFRCVRLALWDETRRRLVSFKEAQA